MNQTTSSITKKDKPKIPTKIRRVSEIEQKNISHFENKIIEKCKSEKPDILDSIASSGKLEENTEKSLTEIINQLKKNFNS